MGKTRIETVVGRRLIDAAKKGTLQQETVTQLILVSLFPEATTSQIEIATRVLSQLFEALKGEEK